MAIFALFHCSAAARFDVRTKMFLLIITQTKYKTTATKILANNLSVHRVETPGKYSHPQDEEAAIAIDLLSGSG